jgi:NhaA family Na+:H+ antiporter
MLGAGALAGIGFTMSLFIAAQSLPDAADFAAAKLAVFLASLIAAGLGSALLWKPGAGEGEQTAAERPLDDRRSVDGVRAGA